MEHEIADETLDRFLRSQASHYEKRAVISHLLRGCQLCAERLREKAWPGAPVGDYNAVLDRFEMSFLALLEPLDEISADQPRRAALPLGENSAGHWPVSREGLGERKQPRPRNSLG